ncbi:MAG: CDP-alcohol phosphatidyltransferase family protein [Planctomycetes bacterium]|nr:CDP-alcohol phosphatidyltransferase family protein [Planctomycetota bacterium]
MPEPGASYTPASRRPIADVFRRLARWSTDLCVRTGIHPNAISLSSIAVAAAAGACFLAAARQPTLLIAGAALCYLRLYLNMLDGMVALASGKASRWGEILNDLPDRLADLLIFVGVAHSGLCDPFLGYWVAIAALLVAYTGTFGQAVGVQREFSGVMAKPWRMVALHLGSWIALADLWWGDGDLRAGFGLTWIDWTHVVILVGCVQSIWIRLVRILRALRSGGVGR